LSFNVFSQEKSPPAENAFPDPVTISAYKQTKAQKICKECGMKVSKN
jgi:hypothetical protein